MAARLLARCHCKGEKVGWQVARGVSGSALLHAPCTGGVGASACALAHVTGRHGRAMQPTAQAWPIGRARLGAACAAVLVHAWAASALITLVMVRMRMSPLDYDVIHT